MPQEPLTRVYFAWLRDGSYRVVEAVSYADARRYFGADALEIRMRRIPHWLLVESWDDEELRRTIFHSRPRRA